MMHPSPEQTKIKFIKEVLAPLDVGVSFAVRESTNRIVTHIYPLPVSDKPYLELGDLDSAVAFAQGVDFVFAHYNLNKKGA